MNVLFLRKAGIVVVPLYDTLGADSVSFILNQTKARVLIVGAAQVEKVVFEECLSVENVVLAGVGAERASLPERVKTTTLRQLEKENKGNKPTYTGCCCI